MAAAVTYYSSAGPSTKSTSSMPLSGLSDLKLFGTTALATATSFISSTSHISATLLSLLTSLELLSDTLYKHISFKILIMYVNSFDEFEMGAEHIYSSNPADVRCVIKYNHSGSKLIIKITDNSSCVQYKTDTMQDFKKLEKFLHKVIAFSTSKEVF